jgi:hypothetical protein
MFALASVVHIKGTKMFSVFNAECSNIPAREFYILNGNSER